MCDPPPPYLGVADLVADCRVSESKTSLNFRNAKSIPVNQRPFLMIFEASLEEGVLQSSEFFHKNLGATKMENKYKGIDCKFFFTRIR